MEWGGGRGGGGGFNKEEGGGEFNEGRGGGERRSGVYYENGVGWRDRREGLDKYVVFFSPLSLLHFLLSVSSLCSLFSVLLFISLFLSCIFLSSSFFFNLCPSLIFLEVARTCTCINVHTFAVVSTPLFPLGHVWSLFLSLCAFITCYLHKTIIHSF